MPTKSRAQQRLMQAVAHGAKPKGKGGPSRKVAKEFVKADHERGSKKLPERIASAVVGGRKKEEIY